MKAVGVQNGVETPKESEVEVELQKMKKVMEDIRGVLERIIASHDIDKSIHPQISRDFMKEMNSIIRLVRQLPVREERPHNHLTSLSETGHIEECQSEESYSECSAPRVTKDMYELNEQLAEENDFLSKKLQETELYIRKIELQNGLLSNQLATLKIEGKAQRKTQGSRTTKVSYDVPINYLNQIDDLRKDLREAQEFISKNNEEFVRQLQKYNQKIWKLESELDEAKNRLYETESSMHEQDIIISRLKEENLQLEILSRNMKGFIVQQQGETYGRQREAEKSAGKSKLKDFFREKIQESLRRKQSN